MMALSSKYSSFHREMSFENNFYSPLPNNRFSWVVLTYKHNHVYFSSFRCFDRVVLSSQSIKLKSIRTNEITYKDITSYDISSRGIQIKSVNGIFSIFCNKNISLMIGKRIDDVRQKNIEK